MTALGLSGVNASLALPMTADYRPDLDAMQDYTRWIIDEGAAAVTINADTGEGAHLSNAERIAVTEAVKQAAGETPVISGLIASHTSEAVQLGHSLKSAGADGLLVFSIPAFHGTPLEPDLVIGYFDALGEAEIPLMAFNLTPSLGGVVLDAETITSLAQQPHVVALKEASFDATDFVRSRDAIRAAPRPVAFLSGCDNFIYESFVLGADGALLGFAGLAASLTSELLSLVKNHDYAAAEQLNREKIDPLARALYAAPARNSRSRIKYALRELGLIDSVAVRPPLLDLDAEDEARLKRAMTTAGLL